MSENTTTVAVLIDAENVQPAFADKIFKQASSLGTIVAKEIYGAATAMNTWVAPVLKYAIHPNLTIRATKGKNTSDIALSIGAMDILRAGSAECIVIVSSDSDFSALAVRLRGANIRVVGMGTEKANPLWKIACTEFFTLTQQREPQEHREKPQVQPDNRPAAEEIKPPLPKQQPAPKAQPNQKQQPAPRQQPAKEAAPRQDVPDDAEERRRADIRKFLEQHLQNKGGRVMTSSLFAQLSKVPAYNEERKTIGKGKAQQYLMTTYSDIIHVENDERGIGWVCLNGAAAPAAEAVKPVEGPAPAEEPKPTEEPVPAEEPKPAEEPVPAEEPKPAEEPASVEEPKPTEEPAPAEDPAPEEEPVPARPARKRGRTPRKAKTEEALAPAEQAIPAEPAAPAEETAPAEPAAPAETEPTAIDKLTAAGIPAEAAGAIAQLLVEEPTMFAVYNRMRRQFGNAAGREYYNILKAASKAE